MILSSAAIASVTLCGGYLVLSGELTPGDLAAFLMYTLSVAISLGMLASLYSDMMKAVGASARVFALLDRQPRIPVRGGLELGAESLAAGIRVSFENVSFAYPSRPEIAVLRDFNLEIRPGEIVALVGHSGGGKSTCAALLARFYDPTVGRVTINGVDLRDLDPTWFRQHVYGLVNQEPTLFARSIRENILLGADDDHGADEAARRGGVQRAAELAFADEFIRGFPEGYETAVGERGVRLSGGQKQRVAIARLVYRDPALLVLDEATSALDAESEHKVQEALERITVGRTTVIIAHRLSTVRKAPRVLVLNQGRIVQDGTHDQLLQDSQGIYATLVARQLTSM